VTVVVVVVVVVVFVFVFAPFLQNKLMNFSGTISQKEKHSETFQSGWTHLK